VPRLVFLYLLYEFMCFIYEHHVVSVIMSHYCKPCRLECTAINQLLRNVIHSSIYLPKSSLTWLLPIYAKLLMCILDQSHGIESSESLFEHYICLEYLLLLLRCLTYLNRFHWLIIVFFTCIYEHLMSSSMIRL
jgi:hypothetical protein